MYVHMCIFKLFIDKLATCFVCKTEACQRTRPLKKGRGGQYGIADDTIPIGARVCNTCQCKSVRNRYPNCPLPTCPNPKDRAKRLHNIPVRLFELANDIREPIMLEFQIPPQATRCCSACLMRIRRKLDPHVNLTDEERRTTDGDESDVSTSSCDEREIMGGSDTASVESPENIQLVTGSTNTNKEAKAITPVPNNANIMVVANAADTTTNNSTSDIKQGELLLPPLGQAPKKPKISEEYDSSATETADEENENSPANRQSPKVTIINCNSNSSGSHSNMVTPPQTQAQITANQKVNVTVNNLSTNGPTHSATPSCNVTSQLGPPPPTITHNIPERAESLNEFLNRVIERSLKQQASTLPAKMSSHSTHMSKMGSFVNREPLSHHNSYNENSLGHNNHNNNNSQNNNNNNNNTSSRDNTMHTNNSNNNNNNNDVTIVREYRNDGKVVQQQAHGQLLNVSSLTGVSLSARAPPPPHNNNSVGMPSGLHGENMATLSVINTHMPPSQQHLPAHMLSSSGVPPSHQHDLKATITPIVKGSSKNVSAPTTATSPETITYGVPGPQHRNTEPEPQTLDLSLKKPLRDGPSPHTSSTLATSAVSASGNNVTPTITDSRHMHPAQPTGAPVAKHVGNPPTMYRGPDGATLLSAPPHQPYIYHPYPGSVGKGPPTNSLYVSQLNVPLPVTPANSRSQTMGHQPPTINQQSGSTSQMPPTQNHMQLPVNKNSTLSTKLPPKLNQTHIHPPPSPQQQQQQQQQQQMLVGGPNKGSITLGTPVNNAQQIIIHSSPATLSPKFDSLLRQTPPSNSENNKLGSITQGTPIHLPPHHLEPKRSSYDYYKTTQRQSPAQQGSSPVVGHGPPPPPQGSSPQAPPPQQYGVGSPYARSPYNVEPPPVLSTRQIVMHDYITSQQMQGQQRNVTRGAGATPLNANSGKESPSPRNNNSTSGLVFYDKERGRTDYASRASPADHSTPSPHCTPPPQRQGVIQRHNTGSKPPSPAAPQQGRMHVVMPHNYPQSGHDAFSSFVDVAVQQPQLPVPSQKDEKTASVPPNQVQTGQPSLSVFSREHMAAMQLQHHHQAVAAAQHQQAQQQQAAAAAAAAAAAQQHQYRQHAADMQRRMDRSRDQQRLLERDRDMQKRQERERMERMHQEHIMAGRERERIDREIERERDRKRDRERERERREQERIADEREREGRRLERMYGANSTAPATHYMRGPETGPPRAIPDRERDA